MVYFITLSCIYKNHKVKHFNYILLLYNDTNKQNLVPRPGTLNKGQKERLIMKYIKELLETNGYKNIEIIKDLAEIDRVAIAQI